MINLHAALVHHFLELAVADRVSQIPSDSPQNHLPLKMAALDLDHLLPSHRNRCHQSCAEATSHENLRQNRNVYPRRSKSAPQNKIDLAIETIMALGAFMGEAMRADADFIYRDRELLVF
jgi:hypothetical protein